MKRLYGILLISLLLSACATTNQPSHSDYNDSKVNVDNSSLSLADYLRRVPGVRVINNGGQITINIRGELSQYGDVNPLFVVDGIREGKDYSRVAQMVPVDDIKSVEVLKGSDASSAYGLAGAAGVIVIKTKKRD